MRILIVSSHIAPTEGWGTEALNSVRGLRERGHTVEVLSHRTFDGDPCVQHADLPDPMRMLRNPFAWLQTLRALRRYIRIFQPDIIHVTTEPYALMTPFLGKNAPPVVLTANGTYAIFPLASFKTRWLMQRTYRRCASVLAISTYTKDRLLAYLNDFDHRLMKQVQSKIAVWTLGVEAPQRMPARHHHPEKQILFVGGVKPRKGVREVIDACAAFRKISRVPFHLHIMGPAPKSGYVDGIQKHIRDLGLHNSVTIHGLVSETALAQAYSDADLFMMLSKSHGLHFEGYGLVFLEANLRGVPGIGPLDSGCTQVIADGRSGYLAHPDAAEDIALKMQWILEDEKINAEECKKWAGEHSIQRQAEELELAYKLAKNTQ